MTDDPTRRTIAAALDRLQARVDSPRSLALSESDREALRAAAERVRAQLLGPTEPVLTVALAGGTGAGKSTLINALAGSSIAEASEIRPTTERIQVYHHRDDSLGNLSAELSGEVTVVAHDRPELRLKLLVDTPDLDSFVTRHRATTKTLLKRAGLVLYVFSPERYLEERTWSVLRKETEFSACAAVLNKVDRVESSEELEQITDDLRARFRGLGLDSIRVFRVCAAAHVSRPDPTAPGIPTGIDEMPALRAFIECELQASEIARMLRQQRGAVVARLQAEVDRVAPEAMRARLDEAASAAATRAEAAAARLAGGFADRLSAVEAELAPLATLRRHERFWGPFRGWLALVDFLSIGLSSLARKMLGRPAADHAGAVERILTRGGTFGVDDLLRAEAYALQDLLYARGLPVERWRAVAAEPVADSARIVATIAADIEGHFEVSAAQLTNLQRSTIAVVSTTGSVVLSALVLVGLVVMVRDLFAGRYAGLPLLWHLLAIVVLCFAALQGIVGVILPGGARWLGQSVAPQAVRKVLTRTVNGWITAYRADLEADIADLREPLAVLNAVVRADEGPVV